MYWLRPLLLCQSFFRPLQPRPKHSLYRLLPWTATAPKTVHVLATPTVTVSPIQVMSQHILPERLIQRGIQPFDGTASKFWSWVGQIKINVLNLQLTPHQMLSLNKLNCKDLPRKMVASRIAATAVTAPTPCRK